MGVSRLAWVGHVCQWPEPSAVEDGWHNRKGYWICGLWLFLLGLFLLMLLLPLSFISLEYYEVGLKQSMTTGRVSILTLHSDDAE
jgi:hypothetical protein